MANRTRRISRSLPKRSLPPIRHRSTAMRNFASRRYSIDHNARRERGRDGTLRRISRRRSLYFTERIWRKEARKSPWISSGANIPPISLSQLVRPSYPFISRVLLLCAFLHLCRRARWMVAICFSLREIATRYFSRARQTTLTIGHHRP